MAHKDASRSPWPRPPPAWWGGVRALTSSGPGWHLRTRAKAARSGDGVAGCGKVRNAGSRCLPCQTSELAHRARDRLGHGGLVAVRAGPRGAQRPVPAASSLLDGLDDNYRLEIDRALSGQGAAWSGESAHQRLFLATAELLRVAAAGPGLLIVSSSSWPASRLTSRGWRRPEETRSRLQGQPGGPLGQRWSELSPWQDPGRGPFEAAATRRPCYFLRLATTVTPPSTAISPPAPIMIRMRRSIPTGLRVS